MQLSVLLFQAMTTINSFRQRIHQEQEAQKCALRAELARPLAASPAWLRIKAELPPLA